jgi:hypothetical protein
MLPWPSIRLPSWPRRGGSLPPLVVIPATLLVVMTQSKQLVAAPMVAVAAVLLVAVVATNSAANGQSTSSSRLLFNPSTIHPRAQVVVTPNQSRSSSSHRCTNPQIRSSRVLVYCCFPLTVHPQGQSCLSSTSSCCCNPVGFLSKCCCCLPLLELTAFSVQVLLLSLSWAASAFCHVLQFFYMLLLLGICCYTRP